MSTTQVPFERRSAQRFDFHLPVSVRIAGNLQEGCGFTQDLSARGVLFYTDFPLAQGDAIELTLVMPSEITLGENMRVRCRGRVIRVVPTVAGGKSAVACHLEGYEYLPTAQTVDERARDFARTAALHETPQEEEASVTMHTFDWRGTAPLGHH